MGWTWDDVHDLPQPVYEELMAYLVDDQRRRR